MMRNVTQRKIWELRISYGKCMQHPHFQYSVQIEQHSVFCELSLSQSAAAARILSYKLIHQCWVNSRSKGHFLHAG